MDLYTKNNNKLNETKVGDFVLAFKIIKDLGTAWNQYDAFKLGLIDKNGNKLKSPETKEEKDSYSSYMKIVFNLKRLLSKVVKNNFAQKAVTLLLLKENVNSNVSNIISEKLELKDYLDEESIDDRYIETFVDSNRIHL